MKKFALLTAPFLSMGVAAFCAEASADKLLTEQSSGFVAQETNSRGSKAKGKGPMQEITPQAKPEVTHSMEPFVTGEFIYWKAYEENVHFAYTGAISTTGANAEEGRVRSPELGWEPGMKLGVGFKFLHDGWDLYTNWTWLNRFDGDKSAETREDSVAHSLYHTVTTPTPGVLGDMTFDEAKSDWKMHFNALDLELGRNFYISPFVTLRPHFGLKFGWINQKYTVKTYDFEMFQEFGGLLTPSYNAIRMEQDFFGVGIRTGLDTFWYFTKNWGLYGDFAFAALWSSFESEREDRFSAIDGVTSLQIAKVKNLNFERDLNTITEVLELGLGVRYETTFSSGSYDFYIQAGWEEQIWFNQNQFLDTVDTRTGNATFQGLTVKACLMF